MADIPMSESSVSADPGDYSEASAERMGGSRPAPRGTASYSRRRAVKACQVGAKCIQSPVDLSTFDPASLKILERLDELDRTMKTLASRTDPKQPRFSSDLSKTAFSSIPIELIPLSPSSPKTDLTAELDLCRVNHLLDNFFNYAHVKNPILDEQAARRMVQSIILHGIDWSAESGLTLLICALGCIARPFGPTLDTMPGTSAYVSAETLFHAAQRRIGIAFSSEDIISTQCLFLSGVYMMCIFQPAKAWRFFLQALASCQQPSFLNSLSPPTSSTTCDGSPASHSLETLHQAIYWSSWKSEREMRSYLRPTDFTLTEEELAFYPPFLPTPPNLHPAQELEANGDSCVTRQTVSWYFYLAEISLRRLASNLYTEMLRFCEQSFSSQGTLEALVGAVPHYEEQAQEWISSLPFCLSFDAPAEEDDICRFVLRGHAINLYEMIYWPFLSAYLMKDLVVEERQGFFLPSASWNIRRLAQKALDYHALRLSVNKPGYRHRHHGTPLLIQSCSRSALVLVAAALRNITNTAQNSAKGANVLKLPNGWRAGLDETIDMLAFWENESRQLASIRHVLQAARQKIQ
ncbi:hypothetical protein TrVFT333_002354 [Trichoderma virens FT-333]|nr:hypothetical protein TrVFT333_002354 [Trichoderma virens FT-333]